MDRSTALRPARRGPTPAVLVLSMLLTLALVPAPVLASSPARASGTATGTGAAKAREPRPPQPPKEKPVKLPRDGGPVDVEPPKPTSKIVSPVSLNLFRSAGFRNQDPNYYACTATSVMNMLNFISLNGTGGSGFRWTRTLSGTMRDQILAWERTHDTLQGGNGSDPHGWRNALNLYGWGSGTLLAGSRVYDDFAFSTYERAIKAAVRQLVRFRKPVGVAAWSGTHAHVITGYDGLVGDPFEQDATGTYTNRFTIAGLYLTDPLLASAVVNRRVTYATLATTTNLRIKFTRYQETDSPYDDPYSPGYRRARDEWYGRWVTIGPVR